MNSVWRNRPLIITIIVVIVLLMLLVLTAGRNSISGTESVVSSILSPVQSGLFSAANAVSDFFSRVFSGSDLEAENAELKAQIAELKGQLQDYNEIKEQNAQLSALLNFDTAAEELTYVTASVVRKVPGHWFNEFIINVGKSDGIEVNMPVVNGDGLVGRIVATGANWSRVMTIVDIDSGVSGTVERTRDNGILKGTISTGNEEDAILNMSYLPLDADLVPGDTVITSGLEGDFPRGIRIGRVTEVSSSSNGMKNEAIVTPWVDFYHLEAVMVITNKPMNTEGALP